MVRADVHPGSLVHVWVNLKPETVPYVLEVKRDEQVIYSHSNYYLGFRAHNMALTHRRARSGGH